MKQKQLSGKNCKRRISPDPCKEQLGKKTFFVIGYPDFIRPQVPRQDQRAYLHSGTRRMKWIRYLVSYAIVYQEGMNELQLWHQDANHIQHRTTTNPTRVHRQALTRTGTWKRTNTIPWITPILTPPIILRKKHPLPPRHNPHTQPPEQALDMDHGTHEDRPRPGKDYYERGENRDKNTQKMIDLMLAKFPESPGRAFSFPEK